MYRSGFLEKFFYKKVYRGTEEKDGKKFKKYKKVSRFSSVGKKIILFLLLITLLLVTTAIFIRSCHKDAPQSGIEVVAE